MVKTNDCISTKIHFAQEHSSALYAAAPIVQLALSTACVISGTFDEWTLS
jgi:hypothetical protein